MLAPLTLVSLFVLAAPSPATRVAEADALMAELEYAQAAELLDEALADERIVDEERVQAHMLAGVANRILKRDVDAQLHFERALKLDSTASLPAGQPPKIVTFFEMIRTRHVESETPASPDVPLDPPSADASEVDAGALDEATPLWFYGAATLGVVGAIAAVASVVATAVAGAIEVFLQTGSLDVATREPLRPVGRVVVVSAVAFAGLSALALLSGAMTWAVGAATEGE